MIRNNVNCDINLIFYNIYQIDYYLNIITDLLD